MKLRDWVLRSVCTLQRVRLLKLENMLKHGHLTLAPPALVSNICPPSSILVACCELDGGRDSGKVCIVRNSFYFAGSFAGWFYFSPVSWRVRLR